MIVSELIAALQKLPQELEVTKVMSAPCCCGECFCPSDLYGDVDSVLIVNEKEVVL